MNFGILGTGTVGTTLASALVHHGNQVMVGGRTAEKAEIWADKLGEGAHAGNFAEAAAFGEIVVLAVQGAQALAVLDLADGNRTLSGKVLIDVTNPLDFSQGFPPILIEGMVNTSSLGEQVQAHLSAARVVKCFNTMSAAIMVAPQLLAEPTDIFVAGDDSAAKGRVVELLRTLGWQSPIDLGGISSARATESWLLFWTRLMPAMGGAMFNLKLVRAS
jgi:8-hydroxy-5-deazaflavin:NADPH oxidoreductase